MEKYGAWNKVSAIVEQNMQIGSIPRQRQIYNRAGKLEDVVDYIVKQTDKSIRKRAGIFSL